MIRFMLAAILWIMTFPVAWYLLPKLMLDKPAEYKMGIFTWVGLRLVYLGVIVLPYLPLITYDELGAQLKFALYTLLFISVLSLVIRLFYRKEFVRGLWSAYSYVYDGLLSFYPYKELMSYMVELTKTNIGDKKADVLDLGCGTGNFTYLLLDSETTSLNSVTCIDGSKAMTNRARKKLADKNVEVITAYIDKYLADVKNQQYDVVVMINVLYAQPKQRLLLENVSKILKKGGLLIVADPIKSSNSGIIKYHLENDHWYKLLNPKLIAVWITDNFIGQLQKGGEFIFHEPKDLTDLIESAGYSIIEEPTTTYGGIDVALVATVD